MHPSNPLKVSASQMLGASLLRLRLSRQTDPNASLATRSGLPFTPLVINLKCQEGRNECDKPPWNGDMRSPPTHTVICSKTAIPG